jgi:hypothetical protein
VPEILKFSAAAFAWMIARSHYYLSGGLHTMKTMIVHILVKDQPLKYNSLNPSKKSYIYKIERHVYAYQ